MFHSAVRQTIRRAATATSKRGFASVSAKVAKSDNARRALVAGAGLSLAVAALQQSEVSEHKWHGMGDFEGFLETGRLKI